MASHQDRIVILIPVYDDWQAAQLLLHDLDQALADYAAAFEVLFVDDGSREPLPEGFAGQPFRTLRAVDILRLRRNLGHQRAIAVGLVYVYEQLPCRAVVVMDADGEDRPADILTLASRFEQEKGQSVIFAARAKRLEGPLFRALYQVYRLVHRILTGDSVRIGNFSIVPFESLGRLVVVPEVWNHYAAAVVRSRLRFDSIPIARGRRLAGKSKMNFIGLLLHGLSAFFVYGDIVGARLLVGITLALLLEFAALAVGVGVRFAVSPDILGLTVYLAAILGVILLQAIPIALILVFVVIGRTNTGFLPIRDCPYFVSSVQRIFPAPRAI
ncbi:MAG TPA: glycosyltransferase [Bryobacteraceae bacterium]|nr:glycosyltransferase [Bryobacteraceae bacterium]